MKKLFVILLTLCLTIPAVGAEIDVSGLTDAELFDLQTKIEAEIVSRNLTDATLIPKGKFEVGVDVPAQKVLLYSLDEISGVYLYDSRENLIALKSYDTIHAYEEDPSFASFEEGTWIQVLDPVYAVPFEPLM